MKPSIHRVSISAGLGLALLVATSPLGASAADCGRPPRGCDVLGCTVGLGSCAPVQPIGPGSGRPLTGDPHPPVFNYVPTCPGNNAYNDALCGAALTQCKQADLIQFWVYVQTWDPATGDYGPPVRQPGVVCYGADQPGVDPRIAVIAQVRRDWKSYPIPGATVATQPADGTLAGAVTRFSSDTPRRFALAPQTILGFSVTVTVTATQYVWLFGDGASALVPSGGGLAAEHVYRTAGPMAVSLRSSYTGTFTIGGAAEVYPLDGVAEVPGQQRVLPVGQARTQLEAGASN